MEEKSGKFYSKVHWMQLEMQLSVIILSIDLEMKEWILVNKWETEGKLNTRIRRQI